MSLHIAGELDQTTFKGPFQPKWFYDSICDSIIWAKADGDRRLMEHYTRTCSLQLVWEYSHSCDAWWTRCFQVPGQLLLELLTCMLCFLPTSLPPQRSVNFLSTICYSAASLFLTSVWFARNWTDKWGVTTAEHFGAKKLDNEVMLRF